MTILDPILNPLLKFPVIWIVIGLAFVISVMVTLIYKFATNQNTMKRLKDEIKSYQTQIKAEKNNLAKAMELNKKAMQCNMEYMRHSMRATLITFIPVIFLFSWMGSHLAYEPIKSGTEFTVTALFDSKTAGKTEIIVPEGIVVKDDITKDITSGSASWLLAGTEGEYELKFRYAQEEQNKEIIISDENLYSEPVMKIKDSSFKQITVGNTQRKILNLFGWKLGWLGNYIIFSLVFSMALRKVLKVY